ncbi:hypothetical protein GMSM_17250 [Geomonas sp. Red276]
MSKKKLLFLSSHFPSKSVPQAGQAIAFDRLEEYARDYDIYLMAFVNEAEMGHVDPALEKLCSQVSLFEVSVRQRMLGILTHPSLPVRVASRIHLGFDAELRRILRERRFDRVHFEYTSVGHYLDRVSHVEDQLLIEHDVTYQSFQRKVEGSSGIRRILYRLEYARQKEWELGVLQRVKRIGTLNFKDRDLLVADGVDPAKIEVFPPKVDERFKQVTRDKVVAGTILLWGAMGRSENSDAVFWFLDEIFPQVRARVPHAKVSVVGANPPARMLERASDCVEITGFVEDPIPYFESAQVAAAPLRFGAGIKIKVLEFMAAGLPVVATTVAAEGIDGDMRIADDARGFADALCEILTQG